MVIKYPIFCFRLAADATLNNNIHSVISLLCSVATDTHFPLPFLLKMCPRIN